MRGIVVRGQFGAVLVVGLLMVAGLAPARTLLVERDGSGEYTVIQDALDVAAAGDTVLIGSGRYDDFRVHTFVMGGTTAVLMVPMVSPLTILGVDRDSVIVGPVALTPSYQGHQTACLVPDQFPRDGIHIDGITFEHTNVLVGAWVPTTFSSCRFRFMGQTAIQLLNVSDLHVIGCEFESSPEVGWVDGIVGFVGGQNPGLVVRDCVFRHQLNSCVVPTGSAGFEISGCSFEDIGVAAEIQFGSTGVIRDCVVGPSAPGVGRIYVSGRSVVDLENLRFSESSAQLVLFDRGTQVTGRHLVLAGGTVYTVSAEAGASLILRDCDILNGGGQGTVLAADNPLTGAVVDLRECYWGTTDSTQIAAWIYDGNDDPQMNVKVQFMPFRTSTTPARQQSVGGLKAWFRR